MFYLYAHITRSHAPRTPELEQLEHNRILGHRRAELNDMANCVRDPRCGTLVAGGHPHHVPREPRRGHTHRAQRRHRVEAAYSFLRDSYE